MYIQRFVDLVQIFHVAGVWVIPNSLINNVDGVSSVLFKTILGVFYIVIILEE